MKKETTPAEIICGLPENTPEEFVEDILRQTANLSTFGLELDTIAFQEGGQSSVVGYEGGKESI